MSMHCGYVVKVEYLRSHNNADKLQIATFFGNDTCVSLDTAIGEIGIYFPSDLQLSEEYCEYNHLCRKKKDGTPDTGYLNPDKRNVKAIKLRGERSEGIFMPLSSLCYTGVNLDDIHIGDTITVVNGHEICCKYIPRSNRHSNYTSSSSRTRKHKVPVAPLFAEHADTEQLAYNLEAFKPGDEVEITLKMHGTSQRTGYLPVLKGYKRTLLDRLLRREGKPIYDWDYVSGTRRVVLENYEGGFYGDNQFREQHSKVFEGKLWKGETVYYEVVGFTTNGTPIMASASNKKLNDKEFIKQYGEETVFSYGCSSADIMDEAKKLIEKGSLYLEDYKPKSDIYVYRMTMTNEDGFVVEYTPDFMRYRCEQMGVKTVPVFAKATIDGEGVHVYSPDGELYGFVHQGDVGETVKEVAEKYYDGPDPVGKNHIREGVVVRILNRPRFTAYKHKNHSFKMISGIISEAVADGAVEVNADVLIEL